MATYPGFHLAPIVGGYINPAFSGPPPPPPPSGEKSTWLHNPCLLKVPHSGEKATRLHAPCLLRDPMVGGSQCGYITDDVSRSPQCTEINVEA